MAPLSFFRGQGGGADSTTAQVPPEAPRTPPPPGEVRRADPTSPGSAAAAGNSVGAATASGVVTNADQSPSSSSRLNPARLLRRKNSRSLRPAGDRDRDRSRERGDETRWLSHALGLGHTHHSHTSSPDARKNGHANVNGSASAGVTANGAANANANTNVGLAPKANGGVHGRRPSAGSASMPAPALAPALVVPSSPSIKQHAPSTSAAPALGSLPSGSSTSLTAGIHGQPNSTPSSNAGGVSANNFGSVRSFRSFRSDGGSSVPADTETILGPSPDHPLIKGEPSVHHQPFALRPETPPPGTFPTALSPPPPRRPQRSPIPPPPPRPTHGNLAGTPRSRPGTPSSASSSAENVDTGRVVRGPDNGLANGGNGVADESEVRAHTAAWLARKPSGRGKKRNGSSSSSGIKPERLPRAGSASSTNLSRESLSGDSVDEPASPAMSPPSGGFPAAAATFAKQQFTPTPPRPEFSPSTTALPLGGQRTSFLLPRPRTPERSSYAISVQCVPGDDDEVKWEVVLRRTPASRSGSGASAEAPAPAPTGPVQLAPGESISHAAPPLASSINLSLALDTDSPSGKLVFITLPSDATPTRSRSRSSASTSSPRVYPGGGTRPAAPPLTFVRGDLYPSAGMRETFVGPPASAPPGQLFPLHGPSVLGPPAPLSAPIAPPSAYVEPLSPRTAAYKRQGAVWASSGGSPSPARPRVGSPDVFRSPLSSPDRAHSSPDRASFESARQSIDGAVEMI